MNAPPRTSVGLPRRLLAGALGLVGAPALWSTTSGRERAVILLPMSALALAAALVHLPRLGPQLATRAIWWANLVLGFLLCVLGGSHERDPGLGLALACAAALLIAGRRGLAEASERQAYAPAAFRGSLLLLMVLALADAQTFLLFGLLSAQDGDKEAVYFFLAAAGLAAGFVGLFRLAVWGAIVNVIVCALMFLVALGHGFDEDQIRHIVEGLALAQLVAATPMFVGIARRRPLVRMPPRVGAVLAPLVVVAIAGLSVLGWMRVLDLR